MARAAAASELFQKSLGRTSVQSEKAGSALRKADGDTAKFSATVTRSKRDLDSFSGRLGLVASAIGALGPAAVPITAVAIPAVTGLAQELGFAALAGGTAVLAFQGVGDALTAMNKAHLEPTAANIEKARKAMEQLSPAAQDLVRKLESMRGELGKLKDAAGSGILPGATAALDDLEKRLPIVERILHEVSAAVGDALRDGAESLAGPEWDKFFRFIATEARPELTKLAKSIGNVAHGLAEMWVAFGPLNSDFSSWMLKASRDFNSWATGLSKTEGFADFVAYIRENGPRVADAVGSIANAMLQIVEAATPIGGPVLHTISAVADAIAAIADSPLGTPIFGAVAAFSALSLAMKAWAAIGRSSVGQFVVGQQQVRASLLATVSAQERATLSASALAARQTRARGAMVGMGAQAAVLGLMMTGVTDKVGLNNTALLGLAGSLAGPYGAAAGASIGLTMDLAKANNDLSDAITRANSASDQGPGPGGDVSALIAARNDLATHFAAMTNDDSGPFGFTGKLKRSVSFLSGDVGQTEDAIGSLDRQISASRGENQRYKDALGLTARGFQLATADGQDFTDAVAGLNAVLSKRASLRDYRQSLRDLRASIKENGDALNDGSAAADANQAALDGVVDKILKVGENLKGANKIEFLKQARADLLKTAGSLDGGRAAVKRLTDSIDELDKKKAEPTIDVNTREAFSKLTVFEQKLAALTGKPRTVYINTVHSAITGQAPVVGISSPDLLPPKHPKDGGFITGPGGPRDDAIPAMISNGEFVVNAMSTSRHRGELERINAEKFADGGYASRDADMQRYQSRQSPTSHGNKMTVSLGDLRVVGTLQTPWGPAQVEGIARAAARDEVNDSEAFDNTHARTHRGGVRG